MNSEVRCDEYGRGKGGILRSFFLIFISTCGICEKKICNQNTFVNLKKILLESMLKTSSLIMLFIMVQCTQVSGTKYYVSSTHGDDGAGRDGRSEATAWKTIAKVNSKRFLPGDSILFRKGDTWRETLIVPSSGKPDKYVYFGSYGTGSIKPKILGSKQAVKWENQGGSIWKSQTSVTDPYGSKYTAAEIFFEEKDGSVSWGLHKADTLSLKEEYDWTCVDNYLYVFALTDPDTRYSAVEVPQRDVVINIGNTNEYIAIDGFDLRYAKSRTVSDDDPEKSLSGFTLSNSHLGYVGSRANASGYNCGVCRNKMVIKNNEIHEGGRRAISIHIYDADNLTFSDITIDGNELHDGYHGSGVGIAMDGSRYNNRFQNIIIKNNLFYNDPSRNPAKDGFDPSSLCVLRAGEKGASIANVQIYNNIFKYSMNQGLELSNVGNVQVHNNTFYDFNHNLSREDNGFAFHINIAKGSKKISIVNNIFYGTGNWDDLGAQNSIFIESTASPKEVSLDYNLFYEKDGRLGMVNIANSTYYRSLGSKSWSSIKNDMGWQMHEPGVVDPRFVNEPDNLRLMSNSPAIGAGLAVGIRNDRDGFYFNKKPSIGAYEGNPSDIPYASENPVFTVTPNPSSGTITVARNGWALETQIFRIIDMSGRIMYRGVMEYGVESQQYSTDLGAGVYIIQLLYGTVTQVSQKLVVVK